MSNFCRAKGTFCEFTTEYGYCQSTACLKENKKQYNMIIPGIVVQEYLDKQKETDLDKETQIGL